MNNIDFAEMLIKGLLFPHGETEEERLMSLPGEVDACFSNNVHFDKRPKYKPYLNWNIINGRLSRLIRRGQFFAENGLIYEAIFLSTTIIEKVGEMYVEDEVWNDQDLDGEIFALDKAIRVIEVIVNSNALSIDMLIAVYHEFNRLGSMEAYLQYGLISFDDIQATIESKIMGTAE